MTVKTTVSFDVATFKRAYEEWDIDALLALYADDVELIQIDRDHPPSSPRTRQGSDVLHGMLEHCAGAGVVATVGNTVGGQTYTWCTSPARPGRSPSGPGCAPPSRACTPPESTPERRSTRARCGSPTSPDAGQSDGRTCSTSSVR